MNDKKIEVAFMATRENGDYTEVRFMTTESAPWTKDYLYGFVRFLSANGFKVPDWLECEVDFGDFDNE